MAAKFPPKWPPNLEKVITIEPHGLQALFWCQIICFEGQGSQFSMLKWNQ